MFFCAALSTAVAQQAGMPDNSFDTDGKLVFQVGTANSFARAIAVQPDQKIIIAGYAANGTHNNFGLARLMPDGSFDSSFSGDGKTMADFNMTNDYVNGIAIDAAGRIVAGGYTFTGNGFEFALTRYDSNGNTDTTFGNGGRQTTSFGVTTFGHAVAIQADGRILLGGYSFQSPFNQFSIARYLDTGMPDTSFNGTGKVITSIGTGNSVASCMGIQSDGKIVLAGQTFNTSTNHWEFALVRYLGNGLPDPSFGTNGIVTGTFGAKDYFITSLTIGAGDKIIVAGCSGTTPSDNNFTLARYLSDGTMDGTFGNSGLLEFPAGLQNNQAQAVTIQPDGKIVVAGYAQSGSADRFVIARLDDTGNPDLSFGTSGVTVTPVGTNDGIYTLAIQADGKILAAGTTFNGNGFDMAVIRYLPGVTSGISNVDKSELSLQVYPNPVSYNSVLSYSLSTPETVAITVHDINGMEIGTVSSSRLHNAGSYQLPLLLPTSISAGTYFILLATGSGKFDVQQVTVTSQGKTGFRR